MMGVRLRLRVTFTLKGRSQVIVVIGEYTLASAHY
jgi:hypothetical protein